MCYHWGMWIGHVYSWKGASMPELANQTVDLGTLSLLEPSHGDTDEKDTEEPQIISHCEEGEDGSLERELGLEDRETELLLDEGLDDEQEKESDDETCLELHDMYS